VEPFDSSTPPFDSDEHFSPSSDSTSSTPYTAMLSSDPKSDSAASAGGHSRTVLLRGILSSTSSGVLGGVFGALFSLATSTEHIDNRPLTVWTSFLYFIPAFVCVGLAINLAQWRHQIGGWTAMISEWRAYSWREHAGPALCGVMCTTANIFSFLGGHQLGFAASTSISMVRGLSAA
jgi:hypothetical protein